MISEGKGLHPPARIRVPMDQKIIAELVAEATRRDEFRKYSNRNDVWGGGLINGSILGDSGLQIKMSARPILIGLGGEWAVKETLKNRVSGVGSLDIKLRDKGDGGKDFEIRGLRLDVKTRSKSIDGNRVRLFYPGGDRVRNLADVFVFAEWVLSGAVDLLGWATVSEISEWWREVGRGGHTNAIAEDEMLKPICRLVSLIEARGC